MRFRGDEEVAAAKEDSYPVRIAQAQTHQELHGLAKEVGQEFTWHAVMGEEERRGIEEGDTLKAKFVQRANALRAATANVAPPSK